MFRKVLGMAIILVLAGCGDSATDSTTTSPVTSTITAGAGLTAFTYHSSTAYYANFGDAGVTLSGATSASTAGDIASYSWEQISGPAVTITSVDTLSSTLVFTLPAMTGMLHASDQYRWQVLPISRNDAQAEFRLTTTDSAGNTDKATTTIYLFDDGLEILNSGGLRNMGVGERIYVSGPSLKANANTASTTVNDWAWTLTPPAGSSATFRNSGTVNSTQQIASFVPDVAGTYTVAYVSVSSGHNSNFAVNASTYVGVGTIAGATPSEASGQCGACHTELEDIWDNTGHSVQFEQVIGSYKSRAPQPYCWECHTVGYDTTASNSGFDDLVSAAGYEFPSAGTTWAEFTEDNPTLVPLTNIQCENCHGPGGAHSGTITDSKIYHTNWSPGVCAKCHPQEAEWKIAGHNSTGIASNAGRYQLTSWKGAGCARCHTSGGFVQEISGEEITSQDEISAGGLDFIGVSCMACHDPHSQAGDTVSGSTAVSGNDSTQLRVKGEVTMKDDARTVVDAGKAAVCYECHDGNYTWDEVDCDSNADGTADALCETVDQIATQYKRQIHGNPQSFVLGGVGAVTAFSDSTYNFTPDENSWHSSDLFTLRDGTGDPTQSNENNKCVTCHMGTAPEAEEEGYRRVGGHTWRMVNEEVEFIATCQGCHPTVTSFNRSSRADYDGDGTVEGVQDEIKGLLLALATKIRAIDSVRATGGTTADSAGTITVTDFAAFSSQAVMNATQIDVRRAVYNHNLISKDKSLGVHNMAFAIQVLQNTYSAVSQINGGNSFATDYPNAVIR